MSADPQPAIPFVLQPNVYQAAALDGVLSAINASANPHREAGFVTAHELGSETDWAGVYFPSRRYKRMFYRATLATVRFDYIEQLNKRAFQALQARAPMTPPDVGADEASLSHWIQAQLERRIDGLELAEWVEREALRMGQAHEWPSFCYASVNYECTFGLGLKAVVDAAAITPECVTRFIEDFYTRHEAPYIDPSPHYIALSDSRDLLVHRANVPALPIMTQDAHYASGSV